MDVSWTSSMSASTWASPEAKKFVQEKYHGAVAMTF